MKFVLLALTGFLSVSGCNGENTLVGVPSIQEPSAEIRLANERAPLSRILELSAPVPTRVTLDISDGVETTRLEFDEPGGNHSLPVLGFKPGRTYSVFVNAVDENGETVLQNTFEVATDPLPEDFPPFTVTSDPELMEPGVTLFESGGFLIIVDAEGDVIWYYRIPDPGSFDRDVRRMSNGNLLLLRATHSIIEIDMLGNTVRGWHAARSSSGDPGSIPVDANAFHHEVFEMESGNFLVLSLEVRVLPDYPTSVTDPGAPLETSNVVGDVIIEFSPDGTIVNEWPLLDILDPYRLGYSSLIGIWDGLFQVVFGVEGPTRDWSHGNAVVHDTRDDSLIISLRHQDAVIKIDRQTGQLLWILGTHDNWNLDLFGQFLLNPLTDDEFFFQYHQHAPEITDEGNIVLFDNGNNRASPFDPVFPDNQFSRAAEYSIDETSKEVALVWESTGFSADPIFASFLGDADKLPETGNVLMTFGGHQPALVIEVTRTTPPVQVFEISVLNENGNQWIYRAERLPGLYP